MGFDILFPSFGNKIPILEILFAGGIKYNVYRHIFATKF